MADKGLNDILEKYRGKIKDHIDLDSIGQGKQKFDQTFSKEYETFRKEIISSKLSKYEKWCNIAENSIKFKPDQKTLSKLKEAINISHLKITPTGASSFAALVSFGLLIFTLFVGVLINIPYINGVVDSPSFLLPFILLLSALFSLKFITKIPLFIAAKWRIKASNQMVLCILYIIIYLRNTSNLEHAIKFATEHLGAPLSLDLRKVFWDLETGKFATIKESLDNYLQTWRKYNLEFVTAFHLIEGSLYEPTESRRVELLEKGLKVILDGTYEKMMHYAQNTKSPITTLHMLGVILPILGLVIFPLVGSLMGGSVKWYHLAIIYNIIIPLGVYSMGMNVLSKRPTGYQESKISKSVLKSNKKPLWGAIMIALIFICIGLFPVFSHFLSPGVDTSFNIGDTSFNFLDYKESGGSYFGPFGMGATLMSFFIPLGLALSVAYYFRAQTKGLMKIRKETKNLEKEFSSALFQLGNRIGDGVPAEVSFKKVATILEGSPAGKFFKIVDINIRKLGMGLKEAIFNEKTGAILSYPSPLVESSMEVLLESSRKGPKATSRALISISNYVEKIHRVDERLKDLLSEVISSMRSQVAFLTPVIAGIVVGVSTMVVSIIVNLNAMFAEQLVSGGGLEAAGVSAGISTVVTLFQIEGIIPGYFFQIIVGIFVIELGIVLTLIQNGIENASDKIQGRFLLGKNVLRSAMLYIILGIIVVIIFNLLSGGILSSGLSMGFS